MGVQNVALLLYGNSSDPYHLVGMGLAPIRPGKRDQAREQHSGEADGGQPHPY